MSRQGGTLKNKLLETAVKQFPIEQLIGGAVPIEHLNLKGTISSLNNSSIKKMALYYSIFLCIFSGVWNLGCAPWFAHAIVNGIFRCRPRELVHLLIPHLWFGWFLIYRAITSFNPVLSVIFCLEHGIIYGVTFWYTIDAADRGDLQVRIGRMLPRVLRKCIWSAEYFANDTAACTIQKWYRALLSVRTLEMCPICLDEEIPWSEHIRVRVAATEQDIEEGISCPCTHRFCRLCFDRYLGLKFSENTSKIDICCPGENCSAVVHLHNYISNLELGQRKEYLKVQIKRRLRRLVDLNESTLASDRQYTDWAKRDARVCPKCYVITWRYEGCSHITCPCGAEYDWDDLCKCGFATMTKKAQELLKRDSSSSPPPAPLHDIV